MARFKKLPINTNEGKLVFGDNIVDGIVLLAVKEIPFVQLATDSGKGKMRSYDIKCVKTLEGIRVDVAVKVHFSQSISEIAFRIQESVRHNVEAMTEYHIANVNVIIKGVFFPFFNAAPEGVQGDLSFGIASQDTQHESAFIGAEGVMHREIPAHQERCVLCQAEVGVNSQLITFDFFDCGRKTFADTVMQVIKFSRACKDKGRIPACQIARLAVDFVFIDFKTVCSVRIVKSDHREAVAFGTFFIIPHDLMIVALGLMLVMTSQKFKGIKFAAFENF